AHLAGRHRRARGNVLEAVNARDFFDQVFFDFDVEAVRRRHHREGVAIALEREAEAREDLRDFVRADGNADDAVRARHTHFHRFALRYVDDLVVVRAGRAAADVEDQLGDAFDVLDGGRIVDATLEAVAGIGREAVSARAATNAVWPPERGFQINVGGVERDSGAVAAHDARETLDVLLVGDHPDAFIDLDGIAVQQLERFPFASPAHVHAAVDFVEIEHVRRTAQFEHHVVRNVDERGDAALARTLEALD